MGTSRHLMYTVYYPLRCSHIFACTHPHTHTPTHTHTHTHTHTSHAGNPLGNFIMTELQVLSNVVHNLSTIVGCSLTPAEKMMCVHVHASVCAWGGGGGRYKNLKKASNELYNCSTQQTHTGLPRLTQTPHEHTLVQPCVQLPLPPGYPSDSPQRPVPRSSQKGS